MTQSRDGANEVIVSTLPTVIASRHRMNAGNIVSYVCLVILAVAYLYPLLYLANISLKQPMDFLVNPTAWIKSFDFANYWNAWVQGGFAGYIFNSLLYAIVPSAISLVLVLMIAFPIARGYIRGANKWYTFFVMGLFLPNSLIPQFWLVLHLGLFNSRIGWMLLNIGVGGVGLLLLTGYIRSIPKELDEAAAIDGCAYFRFIFTVLMPLVKPALATVFVLSAIGIWNNIVGPTVYLADQPKWPMILGLFKFYGQYSNQWTVLAAGVVIVAAPLIVLYAALQRFIVDGATAGSIKM